MIREILSSDVELAKGMLEASHSEAEILACLASRGIDSAKAAELLADLRHGRRPDTRLAFDLGGAPPAAIESRHAPGGDGVPASESRRRHSHGRRRYHRQGVPWWFLVLAAIFILALAYAFFEVGSDVSKESVSRVKHELPPPPGK